VRLSHLPGGVCRLVSVCEGRGRTPFVLSHLVPGDDPTITDEMWTEGVRKHYQGPIVVGRDLMEI